MLMPNDIIITGGMASKNNYFPRKPKKKTKQKKVPKKCLIWRWSSAFKESAKKNRNEKSREEKQQTWKERRNNYQRH